MLERLHHAAYRCRDAEETRAFYEDFLGLPLTNCFEISETKSGRPTRTLHLFFGIDDGSAIAFFEDPNEPFDFKQQRDYDLHIAFQVCRTDLDAMLEKGKAAGIDSRGPADHGFIDSVYFRDPNGYVIELTCPREGSEAGLEKARAESHARLASWQATKPRQNG